MAAKWRVIANNGEMVSIAVELWNGASITLTAWADDRDVTLWTGNGEVGHAFSDATLGSLRLWLDQAMGRGSR